MSDDGKSEETQPPRERQPIFLLPGVIAVLGGVMIVIQGLFSYVLNESQVNDLIIWFAFFPARLAMPNLFPGGVLSLVWSTLTYAFIHGGWAHVLGNVAWLVIFGTPVARRYGALRMLAIFGLSSIIGALAYAVSDWGSLVPLVGASGGIAGATGAAMRFVFEPVVVARHPETGAQVVLGRQMASFRQMFRNPTTRFFILFWIIANCAVPLLPLLIGERIEIAWQAHLGGFFTGILLVPFFEHLHGEPPTQDNSGPAVPPS